MRCNAIFRKKLKPLWWSEPSCASAGVRAMERSIERSIERSSDRAIDRSSDRAIERSIERSSDRSGEAPCYVSICVFRNAHSPLIIMLHHCDISLSQNYLLHVFYCKNWNQRKLLIAALVLKEPTYPRSDISVFLQGTWTSMGTWRKFTVAQNMFSQNTQKHNKKQWNWTWHVMSLRKQDPYGMKLSKKHRKITHRKSS